jgi:uncharacterized membrane protein
MVNGTPWAAQPSDAPDSGVPENVSLSDAIAVALTRKVGSMTTVYLVVGLISAWMALATWGPLRGVDPYPFAFMLFLNNIVQLVLCLAILVGQRVLGVDADRRSLQTYLNTEVIFTEVTKLQHHLDRHDRALSRGISLLQSQPHPWIEQHRVQSPPQAKDQVATANERIAVWLTERLGTMGMFYAAGATQLIWIGMAALKLQRFDPYPFSFMTFLSTLAQLVFMLVIMVGQDVLSRAGARRSEQTFLDGRATLHECRRMGARLRAQDRLLTNLCDYTSAQLVERLARGIHRTYVRAALEGGGAPAGTAALRDWGDLTDDLRDANRAQANHIGEKLAELGCVMVPGGAGMPAFTFDEAEVHLLARLEHERWMAERTTQGYRYGPTRAGHSHPDLVPWEHLAPEAREKDERTIRTIPALLAGEGFHVLRVGGTQRPSVRSHES